MQETAVVKGGVLDYELACARVLIANDTTNRVRRGLFKDIVNGMIKDVMTSSFESKYGHEATKSVCIALAICRSETLEMLYRHSGKLDLPAVIIDEIHLQNDTRVVGYEVIELLEHADYYGVKFRNPDYESITAGHLMQYMIDSYCEKIVDSKNSILYPIYEMMIRWVSIYELLHMLYLQEKDIHECNEDCRLPCGFVRSSAARKIFRKKFPKVSLSREEKEWLIENRLKSFYDGDTISLSKAHLAYESFIHPCDEQNHNSCTNLCCIELYYRK